MRQVTAINNAGQVAGLSLVSNSDVTDGLLYSGGSMTDLGSLVGNNDYGDAYGMNDHGQIVGNSTVPNPSGRTRAFLWQNGTMSDLGDLYGGSANAWAYGINNSGEVVGQSWQASSSSAHAFLWQSGTMFDLGVLPETNASNALAINDNGVVVTCRLSIATQTKQESALRIPCNGINSRPQSNAGSVDFIIPFSALWLRCSAAGCMIN